MGDQGIPLGAPLTPHSNSTSSTPEFSAVIACYYEEQSIDEFYTRLSRTLESTGRSYEIVLVNDGSTDQTFERLRSIFAKDSHVSVIVDFFRNAGQACAMAAGMAEARGRHFIFIDSDLQLDPEELPQLLAEFDKGADIVTGWRKERHDSFFRTIPSKLANAIMRKASRHNLRDFGCTFKIVHGDLIRAFNCGPFNILSLVDVIARAQRIAEVPVTHHARKYGKSGYTFRKLFLSNMDNVVRLSEEPFQILGVVCLALGALFCLRIMVEMLSPFSIIGNITNGLILNILVVAFLVTLAALAAIGEYVIRSFVHLQRTPHYIIREIHRK